MRILLVWPYNQHALDIPETIPLGLGYLAANIKAPHEAAILDATIDRLAPDSPEFAKRLIDEQPRVGAEGHLIAFIHPDSTGGILIELTQNVGGEEA